MLKKVSDLLNQGLSGGESCIQRRLALQPMGVFASGGYFASSFFVVTPVDRASPTEKTPSKREVHCSTGETAQDSRGGYCQGSPLFY